MTGHETVSPAFTVAIAMVVGIACQSLARHLRMPGIVLLLGAGVLLGPDVMHVLEPNVLGEALSALVGFAVAIILFEGGMNLNLGRLKREAVVIRRIITVGAIVTAAGGAVVAKLVMGWDWRLSILFGTLVIVTGPTVITPLLRRIRVKHGVETILEAEGVLIDAIGAIIAVVALEVAISPSGQSLAEGVVGLVGRLGLGALTGVIGGLIIAGLLRYEKIVPEGLENVFTLSMVVTLFHLSEHLLHESGIASVTAAGLVVGNVRTRVRRELLEFKEQLTVMLIGVLFVLLAADVRIREVIDLGPRGLVTVLLLMLVVRPLNVLSATIGTEVDWRSRAFISWLAPRGIVAAAVASLFAERLQEHAIDGGSALRALVFLVIAVTVVVQGLSGGLVARALGLKREAGLGYAIVGANALAIAVGRMLARRGEQVMFIDSNHENCHAAERAGFKVVYGNALEERPLRHARIDSRKGALALSPNEEINLLFAKRVREDDTKVQLWVALHRGHASIQPEMVHELGAHIPFSGPRRLSLWTLRVEREQAVEEHWRWDGGQDADGSELDVAAPLDERFLLPVLYQRGARGGIVDDRVALRRGDVVTLLIHTEEADEARAWLRERGWTPVDPPDEAQSANG